METRSLRTPRTTYLFDFRLRHAYIHNIVDRRISTRDRFGDRADFSQDFERGLVRSRDDARGFVHDGIRRAYSGVEWVMEVVFPVDHMYVFSCFIHSPSTPSSIIKPTDLALLTLSLLWYHRPTCNFTLLYRNSTCPRYSAFTDPFLLQALMTHPRRHSSGSRS